MQRITITIDDELLAVVDRTAADRGFPNRSEAMRALLRSALLQEPEALRGKSAVAVLGYVYDHGTRALPQRLVDAFHEHHDLTVATMHVHLDHGSCLEVSVLSGEPSALRSLADAVTSQRGVRHTNLHIVPTATSRAQGAHAPRRRRRRPA